MIRNFDYIQTLISIKGEITEAIERTLFSGKLILGPETGNFENEFSEYTDSEFCIGVNSGTSAIMIALMALGIGPGDEVITVSNTCVPTISAIEMTGAKPVFVDVNDSDLLINTELIEGSVTGKTKAIIPVHLWGKSVDLDPLLDIAEKFSLKVIEDCAQATGTLYKGKHVGNFGDTGCFSFYPTKNLGAYGDAGAVVTNNMEVAERIKKIRMYGYDKNGLTIMKGANARISEVQAAILRVKLRYLPEWIQRKIDIASFYLANIKNKKVILPYSRENSVNSYHQFVIRTEGREKLCRMLTENAIEYGIHYPVPVHKMPYYLKRGNFNKKLDVTEKAANEILSIPVHEALKEDEVKKITEVISDF